MQAIGKTDPAFYDGLIGHLANAPNKSGSSEQGANFMLLGVKGIQPRDQVEAMLAAAQMWRR
jgi:hypothetical protein